MRRLIKYTFSKNSMNGVHCKLMLELPGHHCLVGVRLTRKPGCLRHQHTFEASKQRQSLLHTYMSDMYTINIILSQSGTDRGHCETPFSDIHRVDTMQLAKEEEEQCVTTQ